MAPKRKLMDIEEPSTRKKAKNEETALAIVSSPQRRRRKSEDTEDQIANMPVKRGGGRGLKAVQTSHEEEKTRTKASLLNATAHEEDEQPLSEADELRIHLRNYPRAWPEPSWPFALKTEDQLCRAHDIDMFWFFEVRDLASQKTANERKFQEPLEPIAEYPPNWPQWQIESDRTRSAMRARKRTPRRLR